MPFTLITGATNARAHQLKQTLGDKILLGDYRELPAFMIEAGKMLQLPHPSSASYAHQMLTLCLDKGVVAVFPLEQQEAVLLAEAAQLFNEFNIVLHLPDDL
ncbi:hypothetical protein LT679_15750 [Mucilaginibacter roseus]|uniref:PylC N-terminal domain-containing protein n=1 Tax=Mucilaginibacter roseus TaxID=1528868 RepID=A0ABS8U7I5_9SPHI|nr:hypothetical protein [Mucilaginibacter roseus]MCD8742068.1 hypothetical protein [Mucilaginibacter roseus]